MSFRLTPTKSAASLNLNLNLNLNLGLSPPRRQHPLSPRSPHSPRSPRPHPALTAPRRLMRKLRSYVTPRKLLHQRRYAEKRLYGDSCDYGYESESSSSTAGDPYDDDDGDIEEDENGDGFVVVPRWAGARTGSGSGMGVGSLRGAVRGEKRAGMAAWEVESRSRMV